MTTANTISRYWTDGALREHAANVRVALASVLEDRQRAHASLAKAATPNAETWRSNASEPLDAARSRLAGNLERDTADAALAKRHAEACDSASNAATSRERQASTAGARLALALACRLVRLAIDGPRVDVLSALCELAERLPDATDAARSDAVVRAISVLAANLPEAGR